MNEILSPYMHLDPHCCTQNMPKEMQINQIQIIVQQQNEAGYKFWSSKGFKIIKKCISESNKNIEYVMGLQLNG